MYEATQLYQEAKENNQPFDPADFGFEFSLSYLADHVASRDRRNALKCSILQPKAA